MRPLGEYPYLIIDARYEKARTKQGVKSIGVLIVSGVNIEGYREILSVEIANTENETTWQDTFVSLKDRGLRGVEYVVSDEHKGLKKAVEKYFPEAIRQRCQCHFMKNMLDRVRKDDKARLKAEIRSILDSPDRERAVELLRSAVDKYSASYPQVADMLEEAGEEILSVFSLPVTHRKRMRTTNMLERYNQEIKRRTRVVRIFPNEEAALRLICALAAEQTEEWLSGRLYIDMKDWKYTAKNLKKTDETIRIGLAN